MTDAPTPSRRWRSAVAAAVLLVSTVGPALAGPPKRVMSIDSCASQYLLALADREQIVSVPYSAVQPRISYLHERAVGLPVNRRSAEEAIAAGVDLVFAGAWGRQTVAALKRLGVPVVRFRQPYDVADVKKQVMVAAKALGHEDRGRALVADIERQEATNPAKKGQRRPLGVVYRGGGYSYGADTLIHSIMDAAGIDNVSARLGYRRSGPVPLEIMLTGQPEILLTDDTHEGRPRVATDILSHPALRRGLPNSRRIIFPMSYWLCGGASVPAGIEVLTDKVAARFADGSLGQ